MPTRGGGIVRQVSKPEGKPPFGPTRRQAGPASWWQRDPLSPQQGSLGRMAGDRPNPQGKHVPRTRRAMGSNV